MSFTATTASSASVLARQDHGGLIRQWTLDGNSATSIFKVVAGSQSKEDMFAALNAEAAASRWAFRVCGLLLAWLGLQMLVGPLTVAPDIVPFIGPAVGDLIGATLCCVTLAVATSTTLTVAALVRAAVPSLSRHHRARMHARTASWTCFGAACGRTITAE